MVNRDQQVVAYVTPEVLKALDAERRRRDEIPSRSDLVNEILERWAKRSGK
jgi:hypothetical protein